MNGLRPPRISSFMTRTHRLLTLLASLLLACSVWGQDAQSTAREKHYSLYFKVSNADIDEGFRDNASTLAKINAEVGAIIASPGMILDSIVFLASASPEGPLEANKRFARKRAYNTRDVLVKMFPSVQDAKVSVGYIEEEWNGLALLIEDDPEIENETKAQILEIIRTSKTSKERKAGLHNIDNGATADMVYKKYCGDLRYCYIVLKFVMDPDMMVAPVTKTLQSSVSFQAQKPMEIRKPEAPQPKTYTRHITLKTNTLGWVLAGSNVALEVDICKHLSFALPFYYSGGLDYFKETIKFRGIVLQPELRYYPKLTENLTNGGLFVGAHFGLGWYNFALDGDYRIQDCDGDTPAWGGGLGVGYSLQFKKNPRWGMEFALGGGVYKAKYDTFYNEANGPYDQRGVEKVWFGVDNAAVSFTYKFDMKKKGGKN